MGKKNSRETKCNRLRGRCGGDTIRRAAGRAAPEDAVRRGGLEVSEACRDRALQERDKESVHTSLCQRSTTIITASKTTVQRVLADRINVALHLTPPLHCLSRFFFPLREHGAGSVQEVQNGPEEDNRMKEFPLVS